jgi:hypothetical protein
MTSFGPRVVYTRDARVPLSADDPEMENGWRCIPVPPTADDEWVIIDNSKDYKTGWVCAGLRWGHA